MNNKIKLVKHLIQETRKNNIEWTNTHNKRWSNNIYIHECTYNDNKFFFEDLDKSFSLNDEEVIVNKGILDQLTAAINDWESRKIDSKIAKIVGNIVLEPEPPKEPSPWLRGRNVFGVAFVISAATWTVFHNPGLTVIALGVGFVGCLIKAAIDER